MSTAEDMKPRPRWQPPWRLTMAASDARESDPSGLLADGIGHRPDNDTGLTVRARWAALAGLTLVSFLLLLDDTAVSVALPTIGRRLGLGMSGLEWVINAYTLALAVCTLPAGRLADRDGRRRVFLAGLAVFTMASLASGLAPTGTLLVAARAVQGVGAALVATTSLAIIAEMFPKSQRGMALGVWAGVSSSAL